MQEQLNVIAGAYPAIPKITADGIYGPATAEAVRVFQKVFGLPQTGEVDYTTWYKISEIYVGAVSYTHLDVYKRQPAMFISFFPHLLFVV